MDIKHLNIFITVVEEGSITKAAQKLLLAQPAVSLAIKQLEEYYNTKLFLRLKQRIYITSEGKLLYQKALKITEDFNNLKLNLKIEEQVKIGSSISMGASILPKVLPQKQFNLFIRTTSEIIKMVENDLIELGIIEGRCYNNEIEVVNFYNDRLVLVTTKDYLSTNLISLEKIHNYSFLLRDKGSGTRDYFDSILKTYDYEVKPTIDSLSYEALLTYAKLGFGIAVVPFSLASEYLETGQLFEVSIAEVNFNRQISYIYKKGKTLDKRTKDLIGKLKGLETMVNP